MTLPEADVAIVGSGPAGVSAAIPLVEAGLRVVMIDGGTEPGIVMPDGRFFDIRTAVTDQWKVFVGERFEALRTDVPPSPKFRAPTNAFAWDGYREAYRIVAENFTVIGSLAAGGLTNAWGAGVSCYTEDDLRDFPIARADLEPGYRTIAARIGISGSAADDLSPFFGRDIPLQPPVALGENAKRLLDRYVRNRRPASRRGVTLGRPRNAVLTEDLGDRQGCDRTNTCAWGCRRRAIYSAAYELERLRKNPNLHYGGKLFVESLQRRPEGYVLRIRPTGPAPAFEYRARVIMLACGAIGSAKLVLEALGLVDREIDFESSPTMGFALWLPERLGSAVSREAFGHSQLSFTVRAGEDDSVAFGNFFGTDGLLTSEFMRYLPLTRPSAIRLMRTLAPSMLLGNCFLPGKFSSHKLAFRSDGTLLIKGGYRDALAPFAAEVRRRLAGAFLRYRIVALPNSFRITAPGEDIHYAVTVPMRRAPEPHEAGPNGEVGGLPGVYVVDGAALSALPAKGHTFTIMANADRIARGVAAALNGAAGGIPGRGN